MLFRIAKQLGRTVSELERELTFVEFSEWCIFLKIESWQEQGLEYSENFTPDNPDYYTILEFRKIGGAV